MNEKIEIRHIKLVNRNIYCLYNLLIVGKASMLYGQVQVAPTLRMYL